MEDLIWSVYGNIPTGGPVAMHDDGFWWIDLLSGDPEIAPHFNFVSCHFYRGGYKSIESWKKYALSKNNPNLFK